MVATPAWSGIGSEGLPFYTQEELQQSPSVKDGLVPHMEARFRRQYTHFITDVGRTLGVPQWAIYTAVFLCHHYFAKRSMKRSDRYLVATACLYLACKVQESPKYLRDVIKEAERKKWERYVKDHPGELRKWDDASHIETMRDQVLVAERAVLYTVSFQLRIKTPYPDVIQMKHSLVQEGPHKQDVFDIAWGFLNDSLHTTLSLQYAPEKLAAGSLYLAHQMVGVSLPQKDGHGFCELTNVTAQELHDVCQQMLQVYVTVASSRSADPETPAHTQPHSQPSSPEDSHLQLQGNRVTHTMPLAMQLPVQQQQQQQMQQHRGLITPETPAQTVQQQHQQQQQQQSADNIGEQQQQQPPRQLPNGLQQHPESDV